MTIEERNEEINEALKTRLDQLKAAIEAHEERLKKMMVARPVSYKYYNDDPIVESGHEVGETQWLIGMAKLNGTWRLCFAIYFFDYAHPDEREVDWKPLVEAAIEDRINAVGYIDKLREEIVKSKETLLPRVEAAIAKLAKGL